MIPNIKGKYDGAKASDEKYRSKSLSTRSNERIYWKLESWFFRIAHKGRLWATQKSQIIAWQSWLALDPKCYHPPKATRIDFYFTKLSRWGSCHQWKYPHQNPKDSEIAIVKEFLIASFSNPQNSNLRVICLIGPHTEIFQNCSWLGKLQFGLPLAWFFGAEELIFIFHLPLSIWFFLMAFNY